MEFLGCASPDAEVTAKRENRSIEAEAGGVWAYYGAVIESKGFPPESRECRTDHLSHFEEQVSSGLKSRKERSIDGVSFKTYVCTDTRSVNHNSKHLTGVSPFLVSQMACDTGTQNIRTGDGQAI